MKSSHSLAMKYYLMSSNRLPDVKFGWDLDGVIGDFSKHYLTYLDFEDQSLPTDWEDPRFRNHIHTLDQDRDFWVTMPTIFNPKLIEYLPFKTVCYCTARNPEPDITREWLWKIGAPYAPLESVGISGDKVESLKKHGVTHYVDDSVSNFEKITDAGITTYLMTRSHNKGYKTDKRVNDIYDLVKSISKEFG